MGWFFIRKYIVSLLLVVFVATSVIPSSYAQSVLTLPVPGTMVSLSPSLAPAVLKGVKVLANDPLRLDFIMDRGDSRLLAEELNVESSRLIKYFLASLTVPENELWVNLSPYEQDRISTNDFGQTEMGRDLLAQDYLLKQLTASVIYPEGDTGKVFWKKIYAQAFAKYGTTEVPVDTFNKVWIVPEKAVVFEKNLGGGSDNQPVGASAYVIEAHLKVMLEQDYFAQSAELAPSGGALTPSDTDLESASTSDITRSVMREVIIPVLEKEVNEGAGFARLRQAYYSLILAAWYKRKVKDSLLSAVYVDQNKVLGVNIDDPKESEKIWARYVEAFRKGVYNIIKEEKDELSAELIPRKYFSGGFTAEKMDFAMQVIDGNDFGLMKRISYSFTGTFYRVSAMLDTNTRAKIARARNNLFAAGGLSDGLLSPSRSGVYRRSRMFSDIVLEAIAIQAGRHHYLSDNYKSLKSDLVFLREKGLLDTQENVMAWTRLLIGPMELDLQSLPLEMLQQFTVLIRNPYTFRQARIMLEELEKRLKDDPDLFKAVWNLSRGTFVSVTKELSFNQAQWFFSTLAQTASVMGSGRWTGEGEPFARELYQLFSRYGETYTWLISALVENSFKEEFPSDWRTGLRAIEAVIVRVKQSKVDVDSFTKVYQAVARVQPGWRVRGAFIDEIFALLAVHTRGKEASNTFLYAEVVGIMAKAMDADLFWRFWEERSGNWAVRFEILSFSSQEAFVRMLRTVSKNVSGEELAKREVFDFIMTMSLKDEVANRPVDVCNILDSFLEIWKDQLSVEVWRSFVVDILVYLRRKRAYYFLRADLDSFSKRLGNERMRAGWAYFIGRHPDLMGDRSGQVYFAYSNAVAGMLNLRRHLGAGGVWEESDAELIDMVHSLGDNNQVFLSDIIKQFAENKAISPGVLGSNFNPWMISFVKGFFTDDYLWGDSDKKMVLGIMGGFLSGSKDDLFLQNPDELGKRLVGARKLPRLKINPDSVALIVTALIEGIGTERFLKSWDYLWSLLATIPADELEYFVSFIQRDAAKHIEWDKWLGFFLTLQLNGWGYEEFQDALAEFMTSRSGEWFLNQPPATHSQMKKIVKKGALPMAAAIMEAAGERVDQISEDIQAYLILSGIDISPERIRLVKILGSLLGPESFAENWKALRGVIDIRDVPVQAATLAAASGMSPERRSRDLPRLLLRIPDMLESLGYRWGPQPLPGIFMLFSSEELLKHWPDVREQLQRGEDKVAGTEGIMRKIEFFNELVLADSKAILVWTIEDWQFVRRLILSEREDYLMQMVREGAEHPLVVQAAVKAMTSDRTSIHLTSNDEVVELRDFLLQRVAAKLAEEAPADVSFDIPMLDRLIVQYPGQMPSVTKALLGFFLQFRDQQKKNEVYRLMEETLNNLLKRSPDQFMRDLKESVGEDDAKLFALRGFIASLPAKVFMQEFVVDVRQWQARGYNVRFLDSLIELSGKATTPVEWRAAISALQLGDIYHFVDNYVDKVGFVVARALDVLMDMGDQRVYRRIYEGLLNGHFRYDNMSPLLSKERRMALFARNAVIEVEGGSFELNLKLVRYLFKRGGWAKLKDRGFRVIVNELSKQFNRERTWHPKARRMGEDEKQYALDLMFADGNDSVRAKEIFDKYFYNDPQMFVVPLTRLAELLKLISVADLRRIVRLVQDDPKQSLGEIEQNVLESLKAENDRRRALGEPQVDVDAVKSKFRDIVENLFVLESQLRDIELVARHFETEDVRGDAVLKAAPSFDRPALERMAADGRGREAVLVAFLTVLNSAEEIGQLKRLAKDFGLPLNTVVFLKLSSVGKLKSREGWVVKILSNLKDVKAGEWAGESVQAEMEQKYNEMLSYVQDNFTLASQARIREALSVTVQAFRKDRMLAQYFDQIAAGVDVRGVMEEEEDRVINEDQGRIPHIFFEPMLRLNASDQVLDQFLQVSRAIGTLKTSSATLKNSLYQSLNLFSAVSDERRGDLLGMALAQVFAWNGFVPETDWQPGRTNIVQIHTDLVFLLRVMERLLTFHIWSDKVKFADEEQRELMSAQVDGLRAGLLGGRSMAREEFMDFFERVSQFSVDEMLSVLRLKGIDIHEEDSRLLYKYFVSDRGSWRDYEGYGGAELIKTYVNRGIDQEVIQVMYDSLLADARGKFAEYKFASRDFQLFLSAVADQKAEEVLQEDRELQAVLDAGPMESRFQAILDQEKHLELKEQLQAVLKALRGELSMELADGRQAVLTHSFPVLLNTGNSPGSNACQTIKNLSSINQTLVGYVANGTVGVVTFLDDNGMPMQPRRIIKYMVPEIAGKKTPVIFVEENTQFGGGRDNDIELLALYRLVDELSRKTGLPVVTSQGRHSQFLEGKRGEKLELSFHDIDEGARYRSYSDYFLDETSKTVSLPVKAPSGTHDSEIVVTEPVVSDVNVPGDAAQNMKRIGDNTGGIDLNPIDRTLHVHSSGLSFKFDIDPAQLEALRSAPGLSPVIISIQSDASVPAFLGIDPS